MFYCSDKTVCLLFDVWNELEDIVEKTINDFRTFIDKAKKLDVFVDTAELNTDPLKSWIAWTHPFSSSDSLFPSYFYALVKLGRSYYIFQTIRFQLEKENGHLLRNLTDDNS